MKTPTPRTTRVRTYTLASEITSDASPASVAEVAKANWRATDDGLRHQIERAQAVFDACAAGSERLLVVGRSERI
jgi:hypothetical protein